MTESVAVERVDLMASFAAILPLRLGGQVSDVDQDNFSLLPRSQVHVARW